GRVVDRVRVGLCGLFRVGLTVAAGPHGLGGVPAGDLLDGVSDGPVRGAGTAVGEHTDDVSTGGLSDLHDLRNQRHPMLPSRAIHTMGLAALPARPLAVS